MRAWKIILPAVIVVFALGALSHAALPTADEIVGKVAAVLEGMKSYEAETRTEGTELYGQTIVFSGHLVIEKSQRDGKAVEKACFVEKRNTRLPDGTEKTEELKAVNDGVNTWYETRGLENQQIAVTKTDSRGDDGYRPAEGLVQQVKSAWKGCKVTGEDVIDGRKMYVLEGAWKFSGGYNSSGTTKVWVGEDDFLVRRIYRTQVVQGPPNARPSSTMEEYLNAKVNQPVDPALFVYTPPAGVKVTDTTAAGRQQPR